MGQISLAQSEYNLNRDRMTHKATDSFELQEVKRLWHSIHNVLREYPFLDDEERVSMLLTDLVTLSYGLKHGRKVLEATKV